MTSPREIKSYFEDSPMGSTVADHITSPEIDSQVIAQLIDHYGVDRQIGSSLAVRAIDAISTPTAPSPEQPTDAEMSTCETLPKPGRILIVDDDAGVRQFAATVLKSAGYQTLEARSGEEAVKIFEQQGSPIDLMLADVVMPRLSGRDLASQAAATHPEIKVLLMSGYPNLSGLLVGIASRSEKLKAKCDFIKKPFAPTVLIQKVRELLQPPAESND